ncbi:hypothetical protein [Rosenbergiella epipactidis]|uniref:hypothetical protein n=1 Tax=Rosenbergiella epipactidis TaxID=1544694 RepID=UPI001F501967|nr:hypothetical protein [Rosenbergiella epipactidis]
MKNTTVFDEIITTCALISLPAVIPSLMEYQYKLKNRIEMLCNDLRQRGYSEDIIDALCRLSCHALDLNTHRNLPLQGLSWQGYELESLFYGSGDDPFFTEHHAALLVDQLQGELVVAVRRLFSLSSFPYPETPSFSVTPPHTGIDELSASTSLSLDNIETYSHATTLLRHPILWSAKTFIPIITGLIAVWLGCYFYLY